MKKEKKLYADGVCCCRFNKMVTTAGGGGSSSLAGWLAVVLHLIFHCLCCALIMLELLGDVGCGGGSVSQQCWSIWQKFCFVFKIFADFLHFFFSFFSIWSIHWFEILMVVMAADLMSPLLFWGFFRLLPLWLAIPFAGYLGWLGS